MDGRCCLTVAGLLSCQHNIAVAIETETLGFLLAEAELLGRFEPAKTEKLRIKHCL